ncbi:penicillin-binding protein 1A [candidate division KSB3 bacterium]|uniref:peptidoglycan glycosyltransferase n=1 Tax=candidate division KSB3 bacterium TaxID=2044937 RepID=A0A2G6E360_9BACT|nr:MAG: penicillin-binding protein 1A [candidate division KSB3 bacterium]PIE29086.1 MAG: penicillin-binding protein 1A [candidate division KSB3 bacterium]
MEKTQDAYHLQPQEHEKALQEPKPPRSFSRTLFRVVKVCFLLVLVSGAIGTGIAGGILYSLYTELPDINRLEKFRPSLVTRVYDRNEELIGEFFIQKRALLQYDEIPKDFINALIAVEDKRFWTHFGVDPIGFARAMVANVKSGSFAEGASTVTQQLTRLLFLSSEKKIPRKLKEMMLAIKIEEKYRKLLGSKETAKKKVLEIYSNQFYWGHGAYGLHSAAKLYFGKAVDDLDLGECAMLAGILQRPAGHSPIRNIEQAKARQKHVLARMVEEGFISAEQAKKAADEPYIKHILPEHQINKAPYFVEYVRQYLEEEYGYRVYQEGLEVHTTLDLHLQDTAREAVRKNLRNFQKRHGYQLYDQDISPEQREERIKIFQEKEWKAVPQKDDIVHAIVTGIERDRIDVRLGEYRGAIVRKHFKGRFKTPSKHLKRDDIILVKVLEADDAGQALTLQLDLEPMVEGALLSIDPRTGHILAMIGGYDFYRSKFNRAVQALRQPGSSFKPFVYLTALERGFTPATIVVDEPYKIVTNPQTGESWMPVNYGGGHKGPMRLRHALETSTNVVAAKLIEQVGIHSVIDTARRLGITTHLNPYPSLALGASEVYMKEIVSAYCAFANRGYRIEPVFITKVLDSQKNVLEENIPRARQVLAEDTTYLLVSMMEGVVQRGTAAKAKALGRPLAGKTGTTNDSTNAWFIGYSPSLVAGAWVGYDESRKTLGSKETGGKAALPIWMDFMKEALKDTPPEEFPVPAGLTFIDIDTATGLLTAPGCSGEVLKEGFKKGTEPKEFCYDYQGAGPALY